MFKHIVYVWKWDYFGSPIFLLQNARMAELAYAWDLKSQEEIHEGSTPSVSTLWVDGAIG